MSIMTHIEEDQAPTKFVTSPKRRKIHSTVAAEATSNELWKWTLTREAIASCFINDALVMKENSTKETDFYWLGRVPCRSVKIAGLLVGVQVYEKRIRYTVDDGTAVIDCLHKQSPPRSPVKKPTGSKDVSTNAKSKALPLQLKPMARVGNSIIVTGRVVRKYETREIVVDSIEKVSPNGEIRHWAYVHQLHKEHYFLSTPFEIPTPDCPSPCDVSTSVVPTTPVKPVATPRKDNTNPKASTFAITKTICRAITSPTSTQTTPSTTRTISPSPSLASSPAKSTATQSPQKLRHPSRLHSRDLNGNTFRIYVKHYMDRMAYVNPPPEADSDFDTSFIDDYPATPIKPSLRFSADATPRASSSKSPKWNKTPRPRIFPLSYDGQSHSQRSSAAKDGPIMRGFTVSYLRRVPELADMAKRVVKAVTKRRLREERQKAKEVAAGRSGKSTQAKPSTGPRINTASAQVEEKHGPRIKRLFQATIVQLLKEGSIVLWDGPTHPCPTADNPKEEVSGLWKANITSTSADSTLFSTASVTISGDVGEEDVLSEPGSNEEAYVPLSPMFLAGVVEEAIGKLTRAPTVPALVGGKKQQVKRYGATTKEGILAFLRKDDRWRYLSEWNIGEALDVLKVEQRAWCVGRGLWELSL